MSQTQDAITQKLERQAKSWLIRQATWRNIVLLASHLAAFVIGAYYL
jgi:hypothetical protein